MPYLVHSDAERREMLEALGSSSVEELLVDVPERLRLERLDLPDGLSEMETMAEVRRLAARNQVYEDRYCFRGGGVYRRFVPAAVEAVISKPEFYTAYPPYQPAATPGTPQPTSEYQPPGPPRTALTAAH